MVCTIVVLYTCMAIHACQFRIRKGQYCIHARPYCIHTCHYFIHTYQYCIHASQYYILTCQYCIRACPDCIHTYQCYIHACNHLMLFKQMVQEYWSVILRELSVSSRLLLQRYMKHDTLYFQAQEYQRLNIK